MDYSVEDYWVYEFAKVSVAGGSGDPGRRGRAGGELRAPGTRRCRRRPRAARPRRPPAPAAVATPQVWGCSQDQSNHIVHKFFESDHFNDGIPIIPGARRASGRRAPPAPLCTPPLRPCQPPPRSRSRRRRRHPHRPSLTCRPAPARPPPPSPPPAEAYETLQRLRGWCDLVVVTSRQHVIQDATLEWIDRHFPGTFQEVGLFGVGMGGGPERAGATRQPAVPCPWRAACALAGQRRPRSQPLRPLPPRPSRCCLATTGRWRA
jgi:hypothetical protein